MGLVTAHHDASAFVVHKKPAVPCLRSNRSRDENLVHLPLPIELHDIYSIKVSFDLSSLHIYRINDYHHLKAYTASTQPCELYFTSALFATGFMNRVFRHVSTREQNDRFCCWSRARFLLVEKLSGDSTPAHFRGV